MPFAVTYIGCTIFISTICWVLSSFIAFHWSCFHCTNRKTNFFQKLDRKLIICQYICMICYTAVPITLSLIIYDVMITNLSKNSVKTMSYELLDDVIYSQKTESYPWPMYIFFLCYFIGRLSSYSVIYLRLKQMLENSIFSYEKKTYNKIFFLLTVSGTIGLTCISVQQGDEGIYYIMLSLWIISDTMYFTSVTCMYLSKLREIKNTYEKSVSQRHAQMSAISTTSSASHDQSSNSINVDCTSNRKCTSIINNPQKISTDRDRINIYDCGTGNTTRNVINDSNERAALELGNIVSIYTKLSIVILLSSFVFFLLITVGRILLPSKMFIIFGNLIDSIINLFCSVLYFQNERNFYKKLFTLQFCCCSCNNDP